MGNVNWIREDINKVKRAATRGNAQAAYELADRLMNGRGVERNPSAAYEECVYAASCNVPEALNMQGYCLATATGTSLNENEAFRCFARAASRGNAIAWYNLGVCYAQGIGLDEPDHVKADTCLSRSAKLGYAKAQVARALRLFVEARTHEERTIAVAWMVKEARQGDHYALEVVLMCMRALKRQRAGLPVTLPALPALQQAAG